MNICAESMLNSPSCHSPSSPSCCWPGIEAWVKKVEPWDMCDKLEPWGVCVWSILGEPFCGFQHVVSCWHSWEFKGGRLGPRERGLLVGSASIGFAFSSCWSLEDESPGALPMQAEECTLHFWEIFILCFIQFCCHPKQHWWAVC